MLIYVNHPIGQSIKLASLTGVETGAQTQTIVVHSLLA